MIILVKRYCKTYVFVIFIYKLKRHLYVHLKNTLDFSIIDSDLDLCLLLITHENVMNNLMIFIFHLICDHFLITTERNKKESERKQKENSKKTIYSLTFKKTERKSLIFRDLNLKLDIS